MFVIQSCSNEVLIVAVVCVCQCENGTENAHCECTQLVRAVIIAIAAAQSSCHSVQGRNKHVLNIVQRATDDYIHVQKLPNEYNFRELSTKMIIVYRPLVHKELIDHVCTVLTRLSVQYITYPLYLVL